MKEEYIKHWQKDNPTEKGYYYFADWLVTQLRGIKKLINTRDRDYVIIIDGQEGSAKSTVAAQVAYHVDKSFTQDRMCLRPEEFIRKVADAKKGQAVVFDEAYTGLASRSAFSEINKVLVEMMMEMRKKNLFIVLCIPSVFYLEKYAALHRARGLFHCYFGKGGKRGQFLVYNDKKLKQLYLYGKRTMSYYFPKVNIKCKFVSTVPIDWVTYEDRKIAALKVKKIGKRAQKQMDQRDLLIALLLNNPKFKMTQVSLSTFFKNSGIPITQPTLSDALERIKDKIPYNIRTVQL